MFDQRIPTEAPGRPKLPAPPRGAGRAQAGPGGTIALTLVAIALHALLLVAIQTGLAHRVPSDETTEAVIAELFAPEPAPRAAAPEPVRRPDPKPVRIARPTPAPAPKTAPVDTPRPELGVEAVRQAVDAAHAATSQAARAPAAPAAPSAPAARPAPSDGGGVAAAASTGPRAVQFGEIQCSTPEPRYPLASRRLGEQGTVRVRLVIDETGAVEQADVQSSSGSERLDRVALEAARATRCRPWLADGRPTRVSAVRPFAFRIE